MSEDQKQKDIDFVIKMLGRASNVAAYIKDPQIKTQELINLAVLIRLQDIEEYIHNMKTGCGYPIQHNY